MAFPRFPQDPYAERPQYTGQALNRQRLMEEGLANARAAAGPARAILEELGAANARTAASDQLGRRPSPEARLRQLAEITQPHVRPDRVTNRNTLTASPLGAFEKHMGVLGPMAGSPRSQRLQAALGAANAASGEQRSILGAPGQQVTPGNSYRANALLDAGMQGQQMQQDREMFEQQAIASALQNFQNMQENRRTLAAELGNPNLYQGNTPQDLAALETQIGLYGGDPGIVEGLRASSAAEGGTNEAPEPPVVQQALANRQQQEQRQEAEEMQKKVRRELIRSMPRAGGGLVGIPEQGAPSPRKQAERLVDLYKSSEGDKRRMVTRAIQQEMQRHPGLARFLQEELQRISDRQPERVEGIARLLAELPMAAEFATP